MNTEIIVVLIASGGGLLGSLVGVMALVEAYHVSDLAA